MGFTLVAGLCNTDTKPGVFRRKSSNVSSKSRLGPQTPHYSSSCPTSPRQPAGSSRKSSRAVLEPQPSTSSAPPDTTDAVREAAASLHRSASTISAFRPRSSPAGLYSYTGEREPDTFLKPVPQCVCNSAAAGSAPSSVHGSRVDMSTCDKGSAIYVGCSAPKVTASTWSMQRAGAVTAAAAAAPGSTGRMRASSSSAMVASGSASGGGGGGSKSGTPTASPKHMKKR